MIINEEEDVKTLHSNVIRGGLKYGALGMLGMLGATACLNKYSTRFRATTLPLKAAFVSMPVAALVTIGAEQYMLDYERASFSEVDAFEKGEIEHRKRLSEAQQPVDWKIFLADHRFKLVALAWVLGVGGTLAYSYKNQYLTTAQKLYQARVYSQGITVAAALATAAVAPFSSTSPKKIAEQNQELFERRLAHEEEVFYQNRLSKSAVTGTVPNS